ncbi:MAG: LolA-like putative outer membrane lipoprotein chaperone [Prevotella sp.]|nr:LolA-like putative outer membrane lipoprotein chaperone [Prevotella sp.]
MKKIAMIALLTLTTLCVSAQRATQAQKVLDKTAAIIGNKSGASANFHISGGDIKSTSGTISIKGNMFYARAGGAVVWYNGKTQWSYLKSTNEVNVTTPTEAQRMKMNPYTFITMYKSGYNLRMTTSSANYQVHMTAQNKNRGVSEIYLTINRKSSIPSVIKMLSGGKWSTITISNFRKKNLPNSMFTFRAKDFPTAEVIDLR